MASVYGLRESAVTKRLPKTLEIGEPGPLLELPLEEPEVTANFR